MTQQVRRGFVPRFLWMINDKNIVLPSHLAVLFRLHQPKTQGLDTDLDVLKQVSLETFTPSMYEEMVAGQETEEYSEQVCQSPSSHAAPAFCP